MIDYEKKFKEKTGYEFNKYYRVNEPKLSCYLTKFTKDIKVAEEFSNMAFMQALEKIDTYNSELSKFITWLTRIAINLVIKEYKDNQRLGLTSIEKELSDKFTLTNILSYDDKIEEKSLQKENEAKCEIIKNIIYNKLPKKYRDVMIMREIENKPYKEISDTIKREREINIINTYQQIKTDEYFYSATITNKGNSDIQIKDNSYGYDIILKPNEKKGLNKEEINNLEIDSTNSETNIIIIETTNLSTIKSQIKKGRYLIRKKVKKDFEMIEKNGID
jgi:RNA polymerase sigma factor (sigma-70 family)